MRFARVLLSVSCLVLILVAVSPKGFAAVPLTLNYQGTLTDAAGQPVNGSKSIKFALYTVASGGTPFWAETHTNIALVGGKFSVTFGAPLSGTATPLVSSDFSGETYVGMTVCTSATSCSDPEMAPRQKFSSVPYALQAGNVDAAAIPAGVIVMWSGSLATIPAGWALCNGSNGTPDLRDRFVVGAGGTYGFGTTGGAASINLSHSHTINDHTHPVNITISGPTTGNDNIQKGSGHTAADLYHTHTYTGGTGSPSNKGMDNQLISPQDIRPPYYALAYIMKL